MMSRSSAALPRYRAFISYSHQDNAWADWLHRALETYAIPRRLVGETTDAGVIPKRLIPIFRDREELASSHDLGNKVNEALERSDNLIVVCSPHAAGSRWVNEEVLAFKRLGRGERIFCLIVGGEPNASRLPGRASEECFVEALRFAVNAQGQLTDTPTEPIAADARPGKDSKKNAKLKLVAGLLDVGLDRLRQREQQRRARRLTAITSLAVVVMSVTSVLAVYALVAQKAAERRQQQAENLVNFMLGDLYDKLAEVQRLDIMQSVDNKAMAYFLSLPNADLTDEALAQRAKALEQIGNARVSLGKLPAALDAFRASTRISSTLAREAPRDVKRQIAYARTESFIGLTYWTQGDLDRALQHFVASRDILLRAITHAPGNLPAKFELQTADNDIGHVQEARGQPAAAEASYRRVLALTRELIAAEPDNIDWSSALGDAHNNLGKLALQRGDLAEAIAEYRADDRIETRMSARDPRNNSQRANVLRVRAILGRTLALAGDLDTGTKYMQQAVDIARQVAKVDPSQTDPQFKLAAYLTQLARLERLGGDLPAAQKLEARSLQIFAALTRKDASNAGWNTYMALAQLEQAAESLADRQTAKAAGQARLGLDTLQALLARQPHDHSLVLSTVSGTLLLADASRDASAARHLRMQALATIHGMKNGADDPRLLALEVEALLKLHRNAEAKPMIRRLWRIGYREPAMLATLRSAHVDYPPNHPFEQRVKTIMQTKDPMAIDTPDASRPPR